MIGSRNPSIRCRLLPALMLRLVVPAHGRSGNVGASRYCPKHFCDIRRVLLTSRHRSKLSVPPTRRPGGLMKHVGRSKDPAYVFGLSAQDSRRADEVWIDCFGTDGS